MQWRRKGPKAPADLNMRIILLTTEVTFPHLISLQAPPSTPNSPDFNFKQGRVRTRLVRWGQSKMLSYQFRSPPYPVPEYQGLSRSQG